MRETAMKQPTATPTTGRRMRHLGLALVLLALVFPGLAHAAVLTAVTVVLTVAAAGIKILFVLAAVGLLARTAPKTSRALLQPALGPKLAARFVPATV